MVKPKTASNKNDKVKNLVKKNKKPCTRAEEFNAFMQNLGQPENEVAVKKKQPKMSKEYPSLTEDEYAGFMANIRRLDARDEKRRKATLATGDANKNERKRSKKEKEGNSRQQNIVQKLFIFS